MNALPVPKPGLMTVGEFLDWPGDGTDRKWELVGGGPVAQALPSRRHEEIQGSLMIALADRLRDRPPCRPLPEAGLYKSRRHFNYRATDVAVTCEPYGSEGPAQPTVVFEILSPSNAGDTLAKLPFYATFNCIQEIVMVESQLVAATVYRRGPGDWADIPAEVLGVGDVLNLRSLGISIPLADLYRTILT